mmetsp:Transcript_18982/g.36499  ORF Transcript_18982/g.36499 Transcript_18982/m.36499 type:complete len:118 (-) Transcript_18982:153-506(-)
MGFFFLPILPTAFECMVECTYPIPEEVTNGIMLSIGNIVSIGATFLWQALIDAQGHNYKGTFVPYNYIQIALIVGAGVFLMPFNGEYRRLDAEKTHMETQEQLIDPMEKSDATMESV